MAFTTVTVTGKFLDPAGNAASGSVTFRLTEPISNGGETRSPVEVVATLASDGSLSQALAATDDSATTPLGVFYTVTENISGCQPRDYSISVPSASASVALADLAPSAAGIG